MVEKIVRKPVAKAVTENADKTEECLRK